VLGYDDTIRGVAAARLDWLVPGGVAIDAEWVCILAGVALAGLVLAPFVSYRYVVRRFYYTLS
jgi:hypothetical protein